MSRKTKEYDLEVRGQAVGMLEAGSRTQKVAEQLGVSLRTVQYWWAEFKKNGSVQKKRRSGRPKILGRVEKIVIAKSIGKKRQSCRKLAKKFKSKKLKGCKSTIYNYLTKELGVKAYHRRKIPKLEEKHIKDRLTFCKMVKNWKLDDWKQVVFSDESPYELFPPPNPKNDVIWARGVQEVEQVPVPKFGPKIMVWGAMSFSGLSTLHIVPQNTSVDQVYYRTQMLEGNLFERIQKMSQEAPNSLVNLCQTCQEWFFNRMGQGLILR